MSMLHRTNLHDVSTPQRNHLKTPQRCLINVTKMLSKSDWFSVTALHKQRVSALNDQSCIQLSTLFMSFVGHLRPHQAIIWSWKPNNGWLAKTTHSGNTSPKQPPQTTLPALQAPGGTKTIHSFCSDIREHICYLNTQSGSRSPLKRLSESCEEAAVLEPVLERVCFLWQLQEPRAPKTDPKPF